MASYTFDALVYFEKSLLIINDVLKDEPYNYYFSATYNNIGNVYFELKDYEKSIEYFQMALNIIEIKFQQGHIDIDTIKHNLSVAEKLQKLSKK